MILGASAIQHTAATTGPTSVKNSTWKAHTQFWYCDGDISTTSVAATSRGARPAAAAYRSNRDDAGHEHGVQRDDAQRTAFAEDDVDENEEEARHGNPVFHVLREEGLPAGVAGAPRLEEPVQRGPLVPGTAG